MPCTREQSGCGLQHQSEHMRLQSTSSCQGWAMARGLSPLQYNPTNELKDSVKCCQVKMMPKAATYVLDIYTLLQQEYKF